MKRCMLFLSWIAIGATAAHAEDLCMEKICIGQDIREIEASWKPLTISAQEQVENTSVIASRNVKEIYSERNELIVAPENVLKDLYPYVIRKQVFDLNVLNKLSQVKAFCTSTTLTGELKHQSEGKVFVTFRATPDAKNEIKLRVIAIERQFEIMAFSLRPQDREKEKAKRKLLKEQMPSLVETRDLDTARPSSAEVQYASALLGFRFLSDVSIPLTLRLRDTEDFSMVEDVAGENLLCKQNYNL